jgi:hypothetical protein
MKDRDIVSLVMIAILCVLFIVNTVWMVVINHPGLAMGSALLFAIFSLVFMYETRNR